MRIPDLMDITSTTIRNVLTRTSGYLAGVASHSLQPYRGCSLGKSLCGVGCYVQHNFHVTRGRPWGGFLEIRENVADSFRENFARESAWARRTCGEFSIFCSSSTEPFPAQERQRGIMRDLLRTMLEHPPDVLILQTHTHHAQVVLAEIVELSRVCRVRLHVSVESDQNRLPGLPPPASTVDERFHCCAVFKAAGIFTVVTVAPLLPIQNPSAFFQRIADVADAVVLDHFIGGDGTSDGSRTRRTPLPAAIEVYSPGSSSLAYLEQMLAEASRWLPGRVGRGADGFAGRWMSGEFV